MSSDIFCTERQRFVWSNLHCVQYTWPGALAVYNIRHLVFISVAFHGILESCGAKYRITLVTYI